MATTKELHKLIANAGMAPPRSAPIADKVMALAKQVISGFMHLSKSMGTASTLMLYRDAMLMYLESAVRVHDDPASE